MDLYLNESNLQKDAKGKVFADVNIWSFIKCQLLAQLLFIAVFYGTFIGIGILWGLFFID